MTTARVNGLTIGFDVFGDGKQPWVLTPGGRYARHTLLAWADEVVATP
jgi:hypothetical protein